LLKGEGKAVPILNQARVHAFLTSALDRPERLSSCILNVGTG